MADDLETVDITGVEILAAGGPVFGVGSPPEGDFWTEDDLRAMAQANMELAGELKPPNKIGHSDGQQLLLNSGLGQPSDGEMPAVGWLDGATFRVAPPSGDEPAKLLADLKDVPKKFADLVKTKAYRTRSVELSRVTSQATGKVYDWAVTGLAWLGAKLPAVRTLDDIVALYAANGVELRRVFAKGDVVWSPTDGYESLRFRVSEALNGETGGGMVEERFWVRDVAGDRALVSDWYDDGTPEQAWIVPFTVDAEGDVTVADRDLWTMAEMAWLEAARSYAERSSGVSRRRADTGAMAGKTTYSDEQRRKFADATGLEQDKVTDEMLAAAGVVEDKPDDDKDEQRALEEKDEQLRALEQKITAESDQRKKLEKKLYEQERDSFIDNDAVKAGKIEPGQREYIATLYDADPEKARKYVASLPVQEWLVREYGVDDDDGTDPEKKRELEDDAYDADFQRIYGQKPMDFMGNRS